MNALEGREKIFVGVCEKAEKEREREGERGRSLSNHMRTSRFSHILRKTDEKMLFINI